MSTITEAVRRLVAWLTERDAPTEHVLPVSAWADLPVYHPAECKH